MSNSWKFFIDNIEVQEPVGWDSVKFAKKRTSHYGIDQPFSDSLLFDDLGAKLLYNSYQTNFINAQTQIRIENAFYSHLFHANYALYEELEYLNGCPQQVSIGLLLSGFEELVNSRYATEVNLLTNESLDGGEISAPPLKEITMFTQPIFLKGVARPLAQEGPSDTLFFTYPFYWQTSDFSGIFGTTFNPVGFTDSLTNVHFVNNGAGTRLFTFGGFFRFFFGGSLNITGGDLKSGSTATFKMQLVVKKINVTGPSLVSTTVLYEQVFSGIVNPSNLMQVQFSQYTIESYFNSNISLAPNQAFQILIILDPVYEIKGVDEFNVPVTRGVGTFSGTTFFSMGSYLNLSEINYDSLNTKCSGIMIFDAFERALKIITGISDPLLSDFFSDYGADCPEWNYLITSGLFIRNADFSAITTSFKFLYENAKKIFNIGWEFETDDLGVTRIRIERESYFYSQTIQGEFSDPDELSIKPMVDKLINQVKIGFTDTWKATSPGGQGEISTEINYFISNKPSNQVENNVLDLRSEFIAAGNSIEFMRRYANRINTGGSPSNGLTTDQPNDQKLFIIAVNKDQYVYPGGEYNPFTNDTSAATYEIGTVAEANNAGPNLNMTHSIYYQASVYNVRIAPSVNALRWLQNLSQFWFRLPAGKQLLKWLNDVYSRTYRIGFSEDCMVVDRTDHYITSNFNRTLLDLKEGFNTPLFQPQVAEFSFPQPLCDFLLLGSGQVKINSGNQSYYGFILTAENEPNDSGNTTFKVQLGYPEAGGAFSDGFSDGFLI